MVARRCRSSQVFGRGAAVCPAEMSISIDSCWGSQTGEAHDGRIEVFVDSDARASAATMAQRLPEMEIGDLYRETRRRCRPAGVLAIPGCGAEADSSVSALAGRNAGVRGRGRTAIKTRAFQSRGESPIGTSLLSVKAHAATATVGGWRPSRLPQSLNTSAL